MSWDAIVGIAEVIGTVAVVISLFYVAVQIKQNTNAMRSASTQNLINVSTNGHFLMASDNGLAQIIQRGLQDPDMLKDYEQLKLNSAFLGFYIQYDFAYRQFIKGELESATWERMEFELIVFLKMPGGAAWWEKDKRRMSSEFIAYIETKLAEFEVPGTIPTLGQSHDHSAF